MVAEIQVPDADWPWQPRFVEVDGARLHYVDVGQGPVVLLVHGTPTWSFEWRHVIRGLSERYRCIAIDHLGFGCSERPAGADYSPEAHAARLAAAVDALGLERFTLVVHDYGGPIGLPLAIDRPEAVERVVVLNSWMWPLDDDRQMVWGARLMGSPVGRWLYRWANASLRLIMPSAYGDRRKLTPAIHGRYLERFADPQARVDVLWALARALLGSTAHYRRLWEGRTALAAKPMLLVWGLADSAFRPYQLARWREIAPHAEVVALERAGHWPHEEEPDATVAALLGFLAPGAE